MDQEVLGQVEFGVVDPEGTALESPGLEDELTKTRNEMQPRRDPLPQAIDPQMPVSINQPLPIEDEQGAATRAGGHERETQGEVDSTGATRTVANPQDARTSSRLAKLVVPTAGGGHWRATWDAYERRVATEVA